MASERDNASIFSHNSWLIAFVYRYLFFRSSAAKEQLYRGHQLDRSHLLG